MVNVTCPECFQNLCLETDLKIGQPVQCERCGAALVVTWMYPVSLDLMDIPEQSAPDIAQPTFKGSQ